PYYGMHKIIRTVHHRWFKVRQIDCLLNVQHNCHRSKCTVTDTGKNQLKMTETLVTIRAISHDSTNYYILNGDSHYSAATH
ncbi:hypothetical protein DFH28DRAFT_890124, partial [Melampsora americana]